MKKILVAILALCACGAPSDGKKGNGLYTGKQSGPITLTTGNNVDLKVPGNSPTFMYRLVANVSGSTLTGIDASLASDGDLILIRNDGTGVLTITDSDATSLAANRFNLPSSVSMVLPPKASTLAEYDGTALKWLASLQSAGGVQTLNANEVFSGASHIVANGTAPTLSTCGSAPAPTIVGSDVAGTVTTGGTATTCTITFATTYGTAPSCIFRPQGTATQPTYTTSATAITASVDIAQTVYDYICIGH